MLHVRKLVTRHLYINHEAVPMHNRGAPRAIQTKGHRRHRRHHRRRRTCTRPFTQGAHGRRDRGTSRGRGRNDTGVLATGGNRRSSHEGTGEGYVNFRTLFTVRFFNNSRHNKGPRTRHRFRRLNQLCNNRSRVRPSSITMRIGARQYRNRHLCRCQTRRRQRASTFPRPSQRRRNGGARGRTGSTRRSLVRRLGG